MKTLNQTTLDKQQGVASLLISIMILIGITLVILLISKTVVTETKIVADNNRISQAVGSANYAMDYAVNYFDSGGFDQDNDDNADNILTDYNADGIGDELRLTSTAGDGTKTTFGSVSFDTDDDLCLPNGATESWQSGLIKAEGSSDDRIATRTITQCVGTIELVRDDGPDQPLVAQGQVFVTGTSNIVNRYTNTTVWSGGEVKISSSSSVSTFIKNSSSGTLTDAELISTTIADNTQLVSNNNLGNGLDIIDEDPNLSNLKGLDFFKNFFAVPSREAFKSRAADKGQVYTNIDDATDASDGIIKSGAIWIEGDAHLTGGTIGSLTKPAVIVVNGNLTSTGNSTIYGILYVIGTYSVGGTINVIGSNVIEGSDTTEPLNPGVPVSGPAVSGNGTLNIIYWPGFSDSSGNPPEEETAVISGSWRDW